MTIRCLEEPKELEVTDRMHPTQQLKLAVRLSEMQGKFKTF